MAREQTVKELEKMLDDPKDHPIIIMSDGSITVDRRRKGKGFIKTHKRDLGSSY